MGGTARGEQLIANQGQEWMSICTTSKRSRISRSVKGRVGSCKGSRIKQDGRKGWVNRKGITVTYIYVCIFVSYMLLANNNALCLGYK
jgi:hypothetical protein